MYYKNWISRFLLRKNLFKRVQYRLLGEKRKLFKNEFDDLVFLFQKLNFEPKVIFDCGANVGYVSYQFYKRFKSSKIYAFEPNPSVYELLVKNLAKEDQSILPFNVGIGNTEGILEFFKNNNTGTSSFLEPNDFHKANLAKKITKIKIPITTISNFCEKQHITEIDVLKLDIEGFELEALYGCEMQLKNEQIHFIFTEVNLIPTYTNQCLIEDIISYLRSFGYYPYNFYGNHETNLRQSLITNILFISNKKAKLINEKVGKNQVFAK